MSISYKIADQHMPILQAINNRKYQVVLVIGERSTGKTTDSAGALALGVISNIKHFENTKESLTTVIMRQNSGSIKASIWTAFLNRINELKETREIIEHAELLETVLKGKKVGQVWAFCKGFKTSTLTDTANSKGIEKANIYLIDEAEEITEQSFEQLEFTAIRENSVIILICNTPYKDHWICKKFLNLLPSNYDSFYDFEAKKISNFTLVRSRLIDNPFLTDEIKSIYQDSGNPQSSRYNLEKYCRDVLGLVSSNIKGKVFSQYLTCNQEEYNSIEAQNHLGLDFGFSNDPTALIEIKVTNGCLYIKEYLYKTGLTIPDTDREFKKLNIDQNKLITADGGGLGGMLIKQLRDLGWNVATAKKGVGSIKNGILKIQEYKITICEDSTNIINEFNNYTYQLDGNKEPTTEPIDEYNHGIDAIRYSLENVYVKKVTLNLKSYSS